MEYCCNTTSKHPTELTATAVYHLALCKPIAFGIAFRGMCIELYQRWQECPCWGFLGPQTCAELFKKCLGPRGEIDKRIVKWNAGMCNECWNRIVQEAREMAEAEAEAEAHRSAASASSGTPQSQQTRTTPSFTRSGSSMESHGTWSR